MDHICGSVNKEKYEFTTLGLPIFVLKLPIIAATQNDTQHSNIQQNLPNFTMSSKTEYGHHYSI